MNNGDVNNHDLEKEYEMLREEIRGNSADLLKITTFALPIAITIMVYAWTTGQGIIASANLLLVYSMVSKQMKYRQSTFRNATYCEVFLEPKLNRNWETRLHKFEDLENQNSDDKKKWNYINRFRFFEWIAVEIASVITIAVKWPREFFLGATSIRYCLFFIIGCCVVVHTLKLIHKLSDIQGSKKDHKAKWEKIKEEEV